jgi:Helix-turn-helix domain of resolvase
MAKDSPRFDPYEAVVADLKAKRAEIDAALAAIERYRTVGGGVGPTASLTVSAPTAAVSGAALPSMSATNSFYGLGFREAGPKQLSIAGRPQTAAEIWEALKANGFTTAHNNPPKTVHSAMRRREKTHGDVFIVGEGKWGRKEWYSEAELEDLKKSVCGMGGRDRRTHIERTKAGMQSALARGAKPGAPAIITAEKLEEVRGLISRGLSVSAIAKRFDVTPQTIYRNFDRAALKELRAQGAPRGTDSDDEKDRVVN